MKKSLMISLLAVLVFGFVALAIQAGDADGKKARRFGTPAELGQPPKALREPMVFEDAEGLNLLTWDDGSFEAGIGPTGGHYDGQFAMRFGGAAATTGLVPFQVQGAYFRLNSGNPGVTNVNVNFWHPLTAGGFPTNSTMPAAQVPAGTATGVTQMVTVAGPAITTANGSVMVGVGGLGTTNWFIDRDSTGPDNNREFAGSNSNNTLPLSYTPTLLGSIGLSGNYFVRLLVDGNVPVELEAITIE